MNLRKKNHVYDILNHATSSFYALTDILIVKSHHSGLNTQEVVQCIS